MTFLPATFPPLLDQAGRLVAAVENTGWPCGGPPPDLGRVHSAAELLRDLRKSLVRDIWAQWLGQKYSLGEGFTAPRWIRVRDPGSLYADWAIEHEDGRQHRFTHRPMPWMVEDYTFVAGLPGCDKIECYEGTAVPIPVPPPSREVAMAAFVAVLELTAKRWAL